MSDYTYSPNQKLAITYTDSNALVSAGAGSGKTAVLTQRIYELVKNGADLSRFLVLTFTNAASAEMKSRIRKKLVEDESTRHLASRIETTHIETFDAFALFLVKKYAFRLGLSPNIKIIDNTLLSIQTNKIRDSFITYLYNNKDSDFLDLISTYCIKNDNQIRQYIIDLCHHVELMRNRDEYIDAFVDHFFDENRLNGFVDDKYRLMIQAINDAIDQASLLEDTDDADRIIESLNVLLEKGTDYDSLVTAYSEFKFPNKGKKATFDADFRASLKETFVKSMATKETFGLREDIINQFVSSKKHVQTLLRIVKHIEHELDTFKREKGSYSFGDIASFALQVLDIPEICKDMSEYFQYILVDEYQDTSAIQELVINKLARNNVCMVGDVKQSIYRFRFADCTIFQEKYDSYKDNKGGKLIDLNTSYRSRKEIVDVVNEIFEQLMVKQYNPINYKDGHHFEYGFTDYDSLIDDKEDYKLKVYRYPIIKGKSACDQESEIMAIDIINKINKKYQVYDSDKKIFRDCSFKDFAIIIDRGKWFDDIKSKFSQYGIPVKVLYDEPVKDSSVAYVLKNLLILLNASFNENYEDDKVKHAFISIARSFLLEYKDQDIYEIVKKGDYLNTDIVKKIDNIKEKVRYSPLSVMLKTLVDEFDIYRNCIKLTHFAANTNKIELFINLTKSMDELGYTIEDLIQYFEDLKTFDLDIPYVDTDVSEDSVTLITIHRSKGLEYPIIYLPGLTSKFNSSNATSFLVDKKYGAVLPITGNTNYSSLFNHLIKLEESKANYEERLRLLYVAITRARERIIMLYGTKENGDGVIINPTTCSSYRSIVHYLGLENKYGVDFVFPFQALKKEEKEIAWEETQIKEISVKPEEMVSKRASKTLDDSISKELLEFGTEIHYLLEIANYETKDLSFISQPRMKRYVMNVLQSKIFENVKNNQVLHEFPFFDEENGVNGVIDCLVMKNDEVDIVDFKLKRLDDDKYVLQLHTYYDYIKQITDLPIKMYLISAITGEVKEVE